MPGAKTASLSQLYAFFVVGLVVSGLNIASAHSNTAAPITNASVVTTMVPSPVGPAIGYGHFNSSCILLYISCSVSVDLHVDSNVKTITYDLPLDAVSSGTCGDKVWSINLDWTIGPTNLTISMTLDNLKDKWAVSSLGFTARTTGEPLVANGTEKEVNAWQNDTGNLKMTASDGKSFKCDQEQDITLQGNVKVTVAIKKMQLQPFKSDENAVFGEADVCFAKTGKPADAVDTIVPTVVGCVLAGLVVILIITYFVGRCKRPGYEKM